MSEQFIATTPIDVDTEELITLGQAGKSVRPHGVSLATVNRWLSEGARVSGTDKRVKPATVLIGGMRFTTVEAMKRFFAAQNPSNGN
jgi:Protein of unknown function (DUF1580)